MIIGLVKHIYIDDTIVSLDAKNRLEVMADKLDPLMRLGGSYTEPYVRHECGIAECDTP